MCNLALRLLGTVIYNYILLLEGELFLIVIEMGNGGYLEVVLFHKFKDGIAFRTGIDIRLNPAHGVERGRVRLIDVAVALGYVVDHRLGELSFAQHIRVHAEIGDWIVGHDHIWGHIAVDAASSFDKDPFANLAFLMYKSGG